MKTLIIKLGALGDVVRTTCLLRVLKGEIYWLTKKKCKDILRSKRIKRVFIKEDENDLKDLKKMEFDLIISKDEEDEPLSILRELKTKKIIGVLPDKTYTPESKEWYDMSLISVYGKEKADELKLKNEKSYPQMLVEMVGAKWKGQEYDIGREPIQGNKIGIIEAVKSAWPNKNWMHYDKLKDALEQDGYEVEFLDTTTPIAEHIDNINKCKMIICADSFEMHVALALKKKVIALFNCTSPQEIYDYGLLTKIVSPDYKKYFYSKEFIPQAITAIPFEEVYSKVVNIR